MPDPGSVAQAAKDRIVNIREIQELLGHNHVETTMIYTHVMRQNAPAVRSPLDAAVA